MEKKRFNCYILNILNTTYIKNFAKMQLLVKIKADKNYAKLSTGLNCYRLVSLQVALSLFYPITYSTPVALL